MAFTMDPMTYKTLYARFFSRGTQPQEFLYLVSGVKDKVVLDLCCGNGRITKLCKEAKAVYAVDESLSMTKDIQKAANLDILTASVSSALALLLEKNVKADVVFCQQAINYWFSEVNIQALSKIMAPGSFFIFNTFNTKPEPIPKVNEYTLEGKEYVEVSWSVNETIHHVQCCTGSAPHTTEFSWISPYRFRAILEPYFTVTEIKKGKSSVYCCQRNG